MIPGPAWEERAQGIPWREGTGGAEGSAGGQGGKIDHLKTVGMVQYSRYWFDSFFFLF